MYKEIRLIRWISNEFATRDEKPQALRLPVRFVNGPPDLAGGSVRVPKREQLRNERQLASDAAGVVASSSGLVF